MIEEDFVAYDDTVLHAYAFQIEKPKAVIQIVHGLQEYSKLYFEFAKLLNKKGYNVYMVDQRAHGKTCNKISEVGKVKGDIFSQSVCDQLCITNMLHERYKKPIYILGHSYGSFILQACLPKNKYGEKYILLGSAFMRKPKIYIADAMLRFFSLFKKPDEHANYLERKVFGRYNRKYKSGSWVTSDEEANKVLVSDKLARVPFSYGFYRSLFSNLPRIYKNADMIDKNLPILILGGTDDPIGDYGKSNARLFRFYKKLGLNAKIIQYANSRHNLLYEKNKDEVYDDILNFLAKK